MKIEGKSPLKLPVLTLKMGNCALPDILLYLL